MTDNLEKPIQQKCNAQNELPDELSQEEQAILDERRGLPKQIRQICKENLDFVEVGKRYPESFIPGKSIDFSKFVITDNTSILGNPNPENTESLILDDVKKLEEKYNKLLEFTKEIAQIDNISEEFINDIKARAEAGYIYAVRILDARTLLKEIGENK